MSILALALIQSVPVVEGSRLTTGTTCYAIVRGEQVIGAARQSVTGSVIGGQRVWDIVVHQRLANGAFDLRDHFVLRQSDLAPIAFDSRKSGAEHVRVAYSPGKAVTTRPSAAPVETVLTEPVWEGNLWGLTFAALPLAQGAHFELPFYQYDKGLGRFTLDVVGSDKVADEDAWIVEATADGQRKVRYFIGKASHAELGYAGGGFASRLGGDCSAIPAA